MTQKVEFTIRLRTDLPKRLDAYEDQEFTDLLDDLGFEFACFEADEVTIVDWKEV